MSAADDELRDKILDEIAVHLRVHGAKDWNLVYDLYPGVFGGCVKGSSGERKFYRWVKKVQGGVGQGAKEARAEAVNRARTMVGQNLPAAPSPAYLASSGSRGQRNLDFLSMIHQVVEDIETLRMQSLATEKDPDTGDLRVKINPITGRPHVNNIHSFDSTIKRRIDTIETGLKIMQEVWDLQRMQRFYDEIVAIIADEIAGAHPEIALKVMERLQALNDREAMTSHANPVAGAF